MVLDDKWLLDNHPATTGPERLTLKAGKPVLAFKHLAQIKLGKLSKVR